MFKFYPFLMLSVTCVACGASFSASDGGSGGSGGSGAVGTAGEASGGLDSSAGSPGAGDAGQVEVAGNSTAGQPSTAGAGGSVSGAGGSVSGAGRGGWGSGGWRSGNGGSGGDECATLAQEYQADVDKARVCDKGSTDECSPNSVAQPIGGCGCPVFVNAKSEYTTAAKDAYQAYQDAKCDSGGAVCNIFCGPAASVSCAQQATTSGNTFVCTAVGAVQN